MSETASESIEICFIKDTELVEDEVSKPDEAETAEVDEDPAAGTAKILLVPCKISMALSYYSFSQYGDRNIYYTLALIMCFICI